MKQLLITLLFVLSHGVAMTARAEGSPVNLDTVHSRIGFTASTLLFDVNGYFNRYELRAEGDISRPTEAQVTLTIDASSIDTDNAKRDAHLQNPDFLDVQKYPQITFKSERITQQGKKLLVTGTLSLHGKAKQVTIPFKVAAGKNGAGIDSTAYKGKLTIDRKYFGVGVDSIAAKISLEQNLELDLLLVILS